MSRTYRGRHLAHLTHCPRKFADGGCSRPYRVATEAAFAYYAHVIHGAPCLYGDPDRVVFGYRNSHCGCLSRAGIPWPTNLMLAEIVNALGLQPAIGSLWLHPWIPRDTGLRVRKFYRTEGHRSCRRKTRKLLHDFERGICYSGCYADDDWQDLKAGFPHARYEIDPWDWD